ncbi:MAG: hypothetical protein AAB295_01660 [Chloroflexota bacterium]
MAMAIGSAYAAIRAIRSGPVRRLPLPIRVVLRSIALTVTGLFVALGLIFALIAYSGSGVGDPCPPYC